MAEDVTGGKVTIPFELSAVPDSIVTLTLSTTDGTAEVGEDFVALSPNTVTIDPAGNNKTGSIEIDITDDDTDEDDETFTVTIDSAEDAGGTSISTTAATASIVVTIIEDDNAVKITEASYG